MTTRSTLRGRCLRGLSVAGLALMTMGLGTIPASGETLPGETAEEEPAAAPADDDAAFHELAGKRNWLSFADARPVSPFFGIPGELRPTVPFARSWLDASPGRSECFAALYYPDEVVEEGVLQTTGQYENRTMSRTSNPPAEGYETKGEFAPVGMPGPHASTSNPSRTECISEAVSGVGSGDGTVLVDGGFARTHAVFDGDKLITDFAVARVQGVAAGPLRIHNLETVIKLEYHLDGEPVISYAMTIAGLEVDGDPVVNLGGNGLVLAGQQVAKRDLIDQFNTEVEKAGATFKEQAVADYLRLVAPVVEEDSDGGVTVTAPAVEISQTNTSRAGQGGDHFGVRLGYATVYALLNSLEGLSLEPPSEADLLGPGGLGVEPPSAAEASSSAGDSTSLTSAAAGLDSTTLPSGSELLDTSAGLAGGISSGSTGYGSSFGSEGGDTLGGATESALPAADTGTTGLVTAAPAEGQSASALQLAAAESARAARNTANGLLGGILVLVGALIWVGGMALAGRLKA
ncbi:MAG: hypothetical protein M3357_04930 [Actinomycetota bacterium]|nr:hypothetical protein [Actinomycetota bacterium]